MDGMDGMDGMEGMGLMMWLLIFQTEVEKEDFAYRLFLARFGQVARLHFMEKGSES